ncbi:MAG: hypothetical protein ABIK31_07045 [candidate division WOR-3 bacterium]
MELDEIKSYPIRKMMNYLIFAGILILLLLNSSFIFDFNPYTLLGSIIGVFVYVLLIFFQIKIRDKLNLISWANIFFSFILVISYFLYTYSKELNSIMFSFSLTILALSLFLFFIIKDEIKDKIQDKIDS